VVCAIGSSDGNFDNKEKAVARLICLELGLNPADFEL
jgi:tellurite resistance protein TerB